MSELAVYDEFRGQLEELRAANAAAVFDYHDKKGNKEARSHVHKLRQTKSAVEEARKTAKADSLAYGRKVDAEAKEIKEVIEEMMDVHLKPLKEIEDADLARIAAHRARIAEMEELGSDVSNMDYTAEQLGNRLTALKSDYPLDSSWEEFALEAAKVKDKGMASLESQIERRQKYEAEQAELERLRKQAAEQEAKDRDAKIAAEAAENARKQAEQEAEQKRLAAEQAANAEREAAERRELELKLSAEKAEREKQEAEQRAKDAEANAKRQAELQAEAEQAEAARREADKEHRRSVNCKAKDAFKAGGMSATAAEQAVKLIAKREIPGVSIAY